jgi:hypothetical protein
VSTHTIAPSPAEQAAIAYLRSAPAIRERCGQLFELARADRLAHWRCDLSQLDRVANYVLQVMRDRYPDWQVPFHSRWRHFEVGGIPRLSQLQGQLQALTPIEQTRAQFDLAIASVLLDAGAGAIWHYHETQTGQIWKRSEGLAIASFHAFLQGTFSSNPQQPLQVDAIGLQQLTEAKLADAFQVTVENPLVGLPGRLALLRQLGQVLTQQSDLLGQDSPRPGHLVDYLLTQAQGNCLPATVVLQSVLIGLGEIWTGRLAIAQVNLGDVWFHSALPAQGVGSQLVPFHKLSQWLTYSLLEPLQNLGLTITNLDQLTGLAEYRNGGLCVDLGLLQAKHAGVMGDRYLPSSEVIVEWRALTLILLDHIAAAIRQKLGMTDVDLPLVKVLEGGTWAAGRRIAQELRSGGVPPIQIDSDGTVF